MTNNKIQAHKGKKECRVLCRNTTCIDEQPWDNNTEELTTISGLIVENVARFVVIAVAVQREG